MREKLNTVLEERRRRCECERRIKHKCIYKKQQTLSGVFFEMFNIACLTFLKHKVKKLVYLKVHNVHKNFNDEMTTGHLLLFKTPAKVRIAASDNIAKFVEHRSWFSIPTQCLHRKY